MSQLKATVLCLLGIAIISHAAINPASELDFQKVAQIFGLDEGKLQQLQMMQHTLLENFEEPHPDVGLPVVR